MAVDDDYDYLFKVVIVGDSSVGKTSIINRLCNNLFLERTTTTVGVDFLVFDGEVKIDNTVLKVKLNIWDTAGEEKYRSLTSVYYRNTDAALIVFDLTRQETFDSVQEWLRNIQEHCSGEVFTVLVGNKCDQEAKVDNFEIDNLAYLHNLLFFETSAKSSINIEVLFQKLCKDLVESTDQLLSLPSLNSGPNSLYLHLQDQREKETTYCCSYV